MSRRRWTYVGLVATVFLVAFVPRAIYPVSRPAQWYIRSVHFIDDVAHGRWAHTVYSEHPGVTTMWLSGIALRLAGRVPEQTPEGPRVDAASLTARESAIGVLPLAVVMAGMVALAYALLLRIFSRLAAFSAALLIALDPFVLANSKVLHVDGLLVMFMVTSALSLLAYLREWRDRWLVLSGLLGGLALLTKSPSLFLVPYTALCLGLGVLLGKRLGWRGAVAAGALWLAVACIVYIALFPAMWVDPIGTVRSVYSESAMKLEWAHPSPIYYLGRPTADDPGPAYYWVVWGCKLTTIASVFALLASLFTIGGRDRARGERASVGLLLAFAFFFTLQMTIGAKKIPRYLLPAFPAIDILAGVGLAWWAERMLASARPFRAAPVVVAAVLVLQAATVLPHHPYYGTHFNELVGAQTGIWAQSTQWQGEGLDIAARTLNKLPHAGEATAGSHMPTLFQQYFQGQTVGIDDSADWYAFGINSAMRNEESDAGAAWDRYRRRLPVHVVTFGSVDYAWLYSAAVGPQQPVAYRFGPSIRLIGYDIEPPPYFAGGTLRLQLYWEATDTPKEDYTVFAHLLDGEGRLIGQQDNQPVRGTRPTSGWGTGEIVLDPYDLTVPSQTHTQELTVAVGLYRWPSGDRLPAYSEQQESPPGDRIVLTDLAVTPSRPQPGVWVARGLAGAVLAVALITGIGRDGRRARLVL